MGDLGKMNDEDERFSIILEKPGAMSNTSDLPMARHRRYHNKSRNGCLRCKRRRIKCDETRPQCSYCADRGQDCQYPPPKDPPTATGEGSLPSPEENLNADLKQAKLRIVSIMDEQDVPSKRSLNPVYKREDAANLLDHFVRTQDIAWIGSPVLQNLMQEHGIRLALDASYLLHAILAFSASHLNYLYPEDKKHRIAQALHYQRSLRQYSAHLTGKLRESDADALFAASMLHTMLAFVHTPVTADTPLGSNLVPSWTGSMQGSKVLVQTPVIRAGLDKGIWSNLVRMYDKVDHGSPQDRKLDHRADENLTKVRELKDLCHDLPPNHLDRYEVPLNKLEALAILPPGPEIMGRFVFFIGTLSPDFQHLVRISEPHALLVLGFWCAFISLIDQWWIVTPARIECRRICEFVMSKVTDGKFSNVIGFLISKISSLS